MELTNKDEQYYHVDFETAKKLRNAGFKYKCYQWYSNNGGLVQDKLANHNSFSDSYSAPLIEIVLVWLYEQDYFYQITTEWVKVFAKFKTERIVLETIALTQELGTHRDIQMLFIQACCKHIIETKKNKSDG